MTGKEENQDDVQFKVTDRRKFNPDGSVKEGVVLEKEEPKPKAAAGGVVDGSRAVTPDEDTVAVPPNPVYDAEEPEDDDHDIPGADDPASFVNFLSTIATNAAASLGAVPHPATGKRSLDLDSGKYWLDVLAMFKEKTKGNLHPKEERLLDGILGDLRMQYVTVVRATEEKLKAQAAKKFSDADILGKK